MDQEHAAQSPRGHANELEVDHTFSRDESEGDPSAVALWLSTMAASTPEALRVTPLYRALELCGRVFRTPSRSYYHYSFQAESIDEFWSHSWQEKAWKKVLLLLILKNGLPALLLSTGAALLMMILFCLDLLPGVYRVPRIGTVPYLFGAWSLSVGLLVFCLTLLCWRSKTPVFLDRVCIHQHDAELKALGVLNIGACLKSSRKMLVLWDATFAGRLWCMFELAAYLKSRKDSNVELIIRPTAMAPICLLWMSGLSVLALSNTALSYEHVSSYVLLFTGLLAWSCYQDVLLQQYFLSVQGLKEQLSGFRVAKAQCHCCSVKHRSSTDPAGTLPCDREVIETCVCLWFGSIPAFEESVRSSVGEAFSQQMGVLSHFPYRVMLGSLVPLLWNHMDNVATRVHGGAHLDAAAIALLGLVWWMVISPTSSLVSILLARRAANRCTSAAGAGSASQASCTLGTRLAFFFQNLAVHAYQQVCTEYISNLLLAVFLFAGTLLIPASVLWCVFLKQESALKAACRPENPAGM